MLNDTAVCHLQTDEILFVLRCKDVNSNIAYLKNIYFQFSQNSLSQNLNDISKEKKHKSDSIL